MKICPACRRELPEISRYCTQCGQRLHADHVEPSPPPALPVTPQPDQLNLQCIYGMVVALSLAILFPPWETPPSQQPPEFLGMHFVLTPPTPDAIVSRLLLTIELVTIAIAGLYGSFFFRSKP